MSGRAVYWRRRARRVSELDLRRLLVIRVRIAAPPFGQEADGEAVGFISVRIDDRVQPSLRERREWDEVVLLHGDAGLLRQLADRGGGEAASRLSRTGREAPRLIIHSAREEHAAIGRPPQGDHRSGHQDELAADPLSQLPQI